MSDRPSFQFYPADWLANTNLRRCSEAARGIWIDVMCVLHGADEYGVIRWPLADLAREQVMRGRLLPEPSEQIAHEKPDFKPAAPESRESALDGIAAILGIDRKTAAAGGGA